MGHMRAPCQPWSRDLQARRPVLVGPIGRPRHSRGWAHRLEADRAAFAPWGYAIAFIDALAANRCGHLRSCRQRRCHSARPGPQAWRMRQQLLGPVVEARHRDFGACGWTVRTIRASLVAKPERDAVRATVPPGDRAQQQDYDEGWQHPPHWRSSGPHEYTVDSPRWTTCSGASSPSARPDAGSSCCRCCGVRRGGLRCRPPDGAAPAGWPSAGPRPGAPRRSAAPSAERVDGWPGLGPAGRRTGPRAWLVGRPPCSCPAA